MSQTPPKSHDTETLDALTGGAFSAPTSGERAARLRTWLASQPSAEQMNEVYRELSARDKGAAKLLRERLDELKRARGQEAIATEWAARAQSLLAQGKLNIADALAWQRDAAKAGAPLSREPLAALKQQLAERVRAIEDLQHRVQVQREAAVLLAQRIEVLSAKSWRDAQAVQEALARDVPDWQLQAQSLMADVAWGSLDLKFPPLLDASRAQLQTVWDAFSSALAQAVAADQDAGAPLPGVKVWADELRAARGVATDPEPRPVKPKVDPEVRAKANAAVGAALEHLELEVAQGHGKASAGAAQALRQALKEHARTVDDKLEARAHAALTAAGELGAWQRWRADQLRHELVAKAEALIERPAVKLAPEGDGVGEAAAGAVATPRAKMGGRKLQETLRELREQWKQTDQGGVPNHALWKRFDDACTEAHKVVEAWLEKVRSESAQHRAHREALIAEVRAWTAAQAEQAQPDWKAQARAVHQFSERWREGGHVGEKVYAELHPQWKAAIHAAALPLETAQKASLERRREMIEESKALAGVVPLRIPAVKALQQRWQAEAHSVPLERRQEQKLWDAFRGPLDEAFSRKSQEHERAAAALSEHDRRVLDAAKALDAAVASGDAAQIRAALQSVEAASRSAPAAGATAAAPPGELRVSETSGASSDAPTGEAEATVAAAAPAAAAPVKRVVAVRGDDRPGMKKSEPIGTAPRGGFGDRRGPGSPSGRPGGRPPERDAARRGDRPSDRMGDRGPRSGLREEREDRGPRLGTAAFRAQRDAVEHAQAALRKLAAQAHGEALTQLLGAWQARAADLVPSQSELGGRVNASARQAWTQSIAKAPGALPGDAVLRLEMAAEVPTPADQLTARRALQLQLLTRRNEPAPAQTWAQDAARVFAGDYDAVTARRVQSALKVLMR